jgi:hypothetical protein
LQHRTLKSSLLAVGVSGLRILGRPSDGWAANEMIYDSFYISFHMRITHEVSPAGRDLSAGGIDPTVAFQRAPTI